MSFRKKIITVFVLVIAFLFIFVMLAAFIPPPSSWPFLVRMKAESAERVWLEQDIQNYDVDVQITNHSAMCNGGKPEAVSLFDFYSGSPYTFTLHVRNDELISVRMPDGKVIETDEFCDVEKILPPDGFGRIIELSSRDFWTEHVIVDFDKEGGHLEIYNHRMTQTKSVIGYYQFSNFTPIDVELENRKECPCVPAMTPRQQRRRGFGGR